MMEGPNLAASRKPVWHEDPESVKPELPLDRDEEPFFSPRDGLTRQFEEMLSRRDEKLAGLMEDWMMRVSALIERSLRKAQLEPDWPTKQVAPAVGPAVEHTNSGDSNKSQANIHREHEPRHSHKLRVRVRTQTTLGEEEAVGSNSTTSSVFRLEKATALCVPSCDKTPEENWFSFSRRKLCAFVTSWLFEAFFAAVILSNSVFIAVQIEVASQRDPNAKPDHAFFTIASIYTFFFTIELILRIFAKGVCIFFGEDWGWMWLDGIIVLTSIFEFIIEVMVSTEEGENTNVLTNMRLLRILRIAKITRAFRIVRLVRFIRSLRTLLLCIGRTLRAMAWSAVLLALIIFLFGLIFTDICTQYRAEVDANMQIVAFFEQRSGSLRLTMHTLFASITGGYNWIEIRDELEGVSLVWGLLFEVYISFCNFAVLNVMTGVFCQSAIESAEKDHELNLEQVANEKEKYFRAVRRLFTQLDQNSDGGITRKEFERAWSDPVLQTVFDALEITGPAAWDLFRQLDRDGSGEVDVDEFLEGCMMIKGPARSIDVVCIKKDLATLRHRLGLP